MKRSSPVRPASPFHYSESWEGFDQEVRKGVKSFFLNADASLSPDVRQLQALFLGGFEVYPLVAAAPIPVADQIDCLVGLFQDLIVFVNVDSVLPDDTWPGLLRRLSGAYGARVRFGVVHHEADPERRLLLEKTFLLEVQVQAGCIYIDESQTPDLPKLQRILVANDANGRRKAIRMACQGQLTLAQSSVSVGRVREVSITNFLCTFPDGDPNLSESQVVRAGLAVGPGTITVDAVVLLKRSVGGSRTLEYVFGFLGSETAPLGLPPALTAVVIDWIQSHTTRKIRELIDKAFQQRLRLRQLRSE